MSLEKRKGVLYCVSPTHPLPPSRVILHTQKSGLVWVECTHTIPTGSDLILLGKSHYFPSWWAPWSTHITTCDNLCWVMSVECFAEIGSSWQTKFHPVRVQMVRGTVSQRWFQSLRPEVISESETRCDFRVWDQRWFQSLRPEVISEFETRGDFRVWDQMWFQSLKLELHTAVVPCQHYLYIHTHSWRRTPTAEGDDCSWWCDTQTAHLGVDLTFEECRLPGPKRELYEIPWGRLLHSGIWPYEGSTY